MAEYIEREVLLKAFRLIAKNPDKRYEKGMQDTIDCLVPQVIADAPSADVQPVKEWHKYPDDIPPYGGDYLCYHKGFCNVYEYFKGQWFSESGELIKQIDKDGLYWQDLPAYPKQ